MPDQSTSSAALLLDALREVRDAGGTKRWLACRFGFNVATELVAAGWATIDNAPVMDALVHVTDAGLRKIAGK